jgi:hypothetical protein
MGIPYRITNPKIEWHIATQEEDRILEEKYAREHELKCIENNKVKIERGITLSEYIGLGNKCPARRIHSDEDNFVYITCYNCKEDPNYDREIILAGVHCCDFCTFTGTI